MLHRKESTMKKPLAKISFIFFATPALFNCCNSPPKTPVSVVAVPTPYSETPPIQAVAADRPFPPFQWTLSQLPPHGVDAAGVLAPESVSKFHDLDLPGHNLFPNLSPDGQKILYSSFG